MPDAELKIKLLGNVEHGACDAMCQKCMIVFTAIQGRIAECPKCGAVERWNDLWNDRHSQERYGTG